MEFQAWPSIPRLNRGMTITEKIDGTNACINVESLVPFDESVDWSDPAGVVTVDHGTYRVTAQSRKRLITPENDNFGFAAWVSFNAVSLAHFLGPGRHYGEWWGRGIQRGYGLDERRFSLFNVELWDDNPNNREGFPKGLDVVPVLHRGPFSTSRIAQIKHALQARGSQAAPGFMNPEGVVVYHAAARQLFKSTFDEFDAYGHNGGKTWQAA